MGFEKANNTHFYHNIKRKHTEEKLPSEVQVAKLYRYQNRWSKKLHSPDRYSPV